MEDPWVKRNPEYVTLAMASMRELEAKLLYAALYTPTITEVQAMREIVAKLSERVHYIAPGEGE